MGTPSIAALVALLVAVAPAPRAMAAAPLSASAAHAKLAAGLRALNDFNDAAAREIFTELLGGSPPTSVAAMAHIYLGLIDFNRLDIDGARAEFTRAVEINPAVEPPLNMSPKARLAFSEAREALSTELGKQGGSPPPPPAAAPAPHPGETNDGLLDIGAAVDEQVAAAPPVPPARSHALSWSLGAAGLALGAVAIVGVAEIASYDSLASSANANPGSVQSGQVAPALANAKAWQPWTVGLGIAAAGLLAAAAVVW